MKAWIVLPASQNKKENPKLNKGIFTLIFFICKMDLSFPHGPHTFLRTEKGANLKSYLTYCRPLNFKYIPGSTSLGTPFMSSKFSIFWESSEFILRLCKRLLASLFFLFRSQQL